MDQVTAAYIAGLWDGEGTIGVYVYNGVPQVRVVLAQSNQRHLELAQQHVGGTLRCVIRKGEQNGVLRATRDSFVLSLRQDELPAFVEHIVPHLKLKRAQGYLLKRYLELKPQSRRGGWAPEAVRELKTGYEAFIPSKEAI